MHNSFKQDFPLLNKYPELVYIDNAATTQKPQVVLDTIVDFYQNYNANVHRGNYALSEKATEMYEAARGTVANFINAQHDEIIFTSGTTDSINKICLSLEALLLKNTSIQTASILLTESEHHSNLIPWQQMALRNQSPLHYVKLTTDFRLDLEDLKEKVFKYKPAILALTHMSNVIGTIYPIKEIVSLVKSISPETLVIVDAAQSIPHMKIDVKDLGCDALSFSGHKIFAATGIGVLYVKSDLLNQIQPVFFGGGMIKKVERLNSTWEDQPHSFEPGTPNIEGAISLAAALNYINNIGFEKINIIESELSSYFLEKAKIIPELKIFGPLDNLNRGPVFSFTVQNIHAHDVATMLDQYNIAVRAGHHCTQIMHREIFQVAATSRASFSLYNTREDIDKLMQGLQKVITRFKV